MKYFASVFVFILIICVADRASSQWIRDNQIIGATLGIEFDHSSLVLAANGEYGVNDDIGASGFLRFFSFHPASTLQGVINTKTFFILGVQGSYHFIPRTSKLDPFVGVLIGYKTGSSTTTQQGAQGPPVTTETGALVGIQAAARYFLNPSMALVGKFTLGSLGFTAFEAGMDFRL